ncbi:hypothetical protein OV090_37710 [Nannocystis sp. RBIL2]|nr:hypothetical protein [Nannocystis sp. RBIL2]MCY1070540.1 hypothetical protein [Nannocystis sp. RBIL2]
MTDARGEFRLGALYSVAYSLIALDSTGSAACVGVDADDASVTLSL